MLWLEVDPKVTLEQRIQQGRDHYCKRFGHAPEAVIINLSENMEEGWQIAGLTVYARRWMLKNHYAFTRNFDALMRG
jgi:hypothetical protein